MKKSLRLLILFICVSSLGFSQAFQGKAIYQSANKMKIKLDGIDPAMQKQVQEMLSKQQNKEYTLAFDGYSSLYTLNESLDASPQQGGSMMIVGFSGGASDIIYKNTKERRYNSSRDVFGKPFLIKDDLKPSDWKLTKETKQIGQYTCYKATYEREQQTFQSISINDEEEDKTETKTETITVAAWYTPDIPVAHGPSMYWGLPGLIMEIKDGSRNVICTQIILNPDEKTEIKEPNKGKVLTESEYEVMMEEKMEEMNKMNSGGKKKGDGHSVSFSIGG